MTQKDKVNYPIQAGKDKENGSGKEVIEIKEHRDGLDKFKLIQIGKFEGSLQVEGIRVFFDEDKISQIQVGKYSKFPTGDHVIGETLFYSFNGQVRQIHLGNYKEQMHTTGETLFFEKGQLKQLAKGKFNEDGDIADGSSIFFNDAGDVRVSWNKG